MLLLGRASASQELGIEVAALLSLDALFLRSNASVVMRERARMSASPTTCINALPGALTMPARTKLSTR